MGKLSNLVPNEKPWSTKTSEIVNKVVTLYDAEPLKTGMGNAYLAQAGIHGDDGEIIKTDLLLSGTVIVDTLDQMLHAMNESGVDFPVDVMVIETRSRNGFRYRTLIDPDDYVTNES